MNENVVMPRQFANRLDADKLQEMKDSGLIVQDATADLEDMKLPEPSYGEETIGTLTTEEATLFKSYVAAKNEFEDMQRDLTSKSLFTVGEAIRDKTEDKLGQDGIAAHITDEQGEAIHRLQRQFLVLRETFFWMVSERLKCHGYTIGVRSKNRIIKSQRKW